MVLYYAAVGLAVLCNLFYHVSQKLTPSGANPALAIGLTYLVAMGISLLVLGLFFPLKDGLVPALRQLNWATVALGIAVVGIEFGFLLAYRAGGNISLAQIVVSAAVTLILIPVGLVFFKEKLSWVNGLGIVLCLVGLVLINIRP
jgi:drug/metabolite transporter (DMT)-like permease